MTLAIAETATSTYSYHLRRVGEEGLCLGGGANLLAICGKKVGWDTRLPLGSWGVKDHIPSRWCKECERIAKSEQLP